MRKRIMLVNDFYAPYMVGGAETLVQELAAGLQARGHDVAVVTARVDKSPSYENMSGVNVYRIGSFPNYERAVRIASGTAPGRLHAATSSDFRTLQASFSPDVTHFHNVWLLGPSIVNLASGHKGITIHDYWPICLRRTLVRVNNQPCSGHSPLACRLCRLRAPATRASFDLMGIEREYAVHLEILASCNFVTAPSWFMAYQIRQASGPTPAVVYNGVDLSNAASQAPDASLGMRNAKWKVTEANKSELHSNASPYVLFASRPVKDKGYDVALRAFARPELRDHVLYVAANAAPSTLPNVKVLGQQPRAKMADLIKNAACVIVPSVWKENCPMIILEALRAGVPIVASRIGGIPELIEEGVTGMLVTPGDAEELALTVRLCCEDEQLRASARHAGPATVRDRFSREVMVTTLERLYAA